MNRTQIYLDDDLATNLRTGAKLKKISVSRYIRQLLTEKLASQAKTKSENPLIVLASLANKQSKTKNKTNVAGNLDKYLPKEWR
ncbi:MAG: CopG family transcriptional regulator [Candidatus Shapirobacteria bacterium]|jgi:hypothetical protein